MTVYKIDEFMAYQISQCQICAKEKICVQNWVKLFNAWLCIECWLDVITSGLDEKPYEIDKNGYDFVEYKHQLDNGDIVKTNISIIDLNRKLEQINSILKERK